MVPFTITIQQAAAPHSSLAFMFWGAGVIVLPLALAYKAAVYFIFHGRVTNADGYGGETMTAGLTTMLPASVPRTEAGRMMDWVASVLAIVTVVYVFFRPRR